MSKKNDNVRADRQDGVGRSGEGRRDGGKQRWAGQKERRDKEINPASGHKKPKKGELS